MGIQSYDICATGSWKNKNIEDMTEKEQKALSQCTWRYNLSEEKKEATIKYDRESKAEEKKQEELYFLKVKASNNARQIAWR